MRLDASIFGILASLVGLVGAEKDTSRTIDGPMPAATVGTGTATTGSSPNLVIQVPPLDMPAIYKAQAVDKTISFNKGRDIREVNISAIYLKRFSDKVAIGMGKMSSKTDTGPSVGSLLAGQVITERQDDQSSLISFPATDETLTLKLTGDLTATYSDNLMQPLYYEFQWENNTSSGTSYSPVLAVTYADRYGEAMRLLENTGMGSSPAFQEEIKGSSTGLESSGITTATATAATETSIRPTSEASHESRKLSTGAIAGITVGCAVFVIAVVVFLVWFFCLRRRNKSENVGGTEFTNASGSHAMIAEKDMVNMSESSPRSVYPPDHSRQLHDQRDSIVRSDDASYAPYSDQAPSPPLPPGAVFASTSQSDLASTGRASTTGNRCQSRYAHLIEEGMTEEEIRRLEEEEQHLDAAIEDAGRNSRATHQS
ncbi:uncharacterized protein F4812DRAFT_403134 [Daldinia caldariorum]|uniref:uncharacterized protein n=1 Tax=Daldinia caldariorum TaxID=326644 RepID=UPI002007E383|nr:uncharacterized protein F4812DRAFT_403134 [Daldinia caldariorum]KAI1467627.1 hypothetical protein F4812DRAFT_403134 [Daldinia caldariorum]